jgi:membrane protease YdiL (CAAX protease family)
VTSCYFGSIHLANSGESPAGLIAAGLIGLVFCLSLWRTGSLWWAIGFHTAWDWAQSFLYGVGDSGSTIAGHWLISHPAGRTILSGGATGPEGSVFVLPTIALAGLGVLLLKDKDAHVPGMQAPLRKGAVFSAPDH